MAIAQCLTCGCVSSSCFFDKVSSYVESTEFIECADGTFEKRVESREGAFHVCPDCHSIDVDVYSEAGWEIERRVAEVQARMENRS